MDNAHSDSLEFIRRRVYILCSMVTIAALAIALLETIVMYDDLTLKAALTIGVTIYIATFLLSIALKKIEIGAHTAVLMIMFLYIPFSFFSGGGISGDAPLWFLFDVIYICIFIRGFQRVLYMVFNFAIISACYFFSRMYPDTVTDYSANTLHMFSYIAVITIGISMGSIVNYMIKLYYGEREKTNKQMEEIKALNDSQNQFFSSMSHEIRTPINTIIGLNEMILREEISEEVAEDAVNIRSAGKMLLNLVNDILDMSKLESGQMHITNVSYNPGDMLSDIVGMLWIRAKEKNLDFKVSIAPDIPEELEGDEVRIKQVLINMLNNAIKYTKEGSVTLSVQCEKKNDNMANIIYTVEDTGIGIKKDDIPFLFTAFKRVDEKETRHIEGTGLGLSIVKRFTELMGGKVSVNSVYSVGSTFVVEIPQKILSENTIGNVDLEHSRNLEKITRYKQSFEAPEAKVLVVDDNASNLLVVKKLLRDTKISIDTVSSGAEALEHTLNTAYNVILMDHLMPEMDGIECFKRIKNQTGGMCRECLTVILTANTGEDMKLLYEKEGFHAYLAKPVSGEELESVLFRLLPSNLVKVTGSGEDFYKDTISWMKDNYRKRQVAITTESVADLPDELIQKYEIAILPHMVQTEDGLFKDKEEIDTKGVLRYMQDSDHYIETKVPDAKEHEEFFAGVLKRANNIIHISISEKVENSGCIIAKEASRAFGNVSVVNSKHLSSGQGIMALEAAKMAEQGKSKDEILERMESIASKINTSFVVDDIDYLAKAGHIKVNISNLTKSFALHPAIKMKNGRISLHKLYFGSRRKVWEKYIISTLRNTSNIDKSVLFVTYVGLTNKEKDWIKQKIEDRMKFDTIYFESASPAIAVNCGPGTFGLLLKRK